MTDIQKEFEIWATAKGFNLTKSHDGTYVYRPAFYAFLGWTKGRELDLYVSAKAESLNQGLNLNDI